MTEEEDIDWVDAGKKILRSYFKNYDYKRWQPFFHGTTNFHYEDFGEGIKKQGLCPRLKTKQPSVWRASIESPEDRVFFNRCGDNLAHTAAYQAKMKADDLLRCKQAEEELIRAGETEALKQLRGNRFCRSIGLPEMVEHWRTATLEEFFGYPPIKFEEEIKPIYLKLKNFEKYRPHLVKDTDENFMDDIKESFYNPELTKSTHKFLCHPRIDKTVIDVLDVIWSKVGYEGVREIVETAIPDVVKGLYSLGQSIAFDTCIAPEDLEVETSKEYSERFKECAVLENDGGCSVEEKEIKDKLVDQMQAIYSTPSHFRWQSRMQSVINELEELLKSPAPISESIKEEKQHLEEILYNENQRILGSIEGYPLYRQKVIEFIEEQKVPKFLKQLTELEQEEGSNT